MGKLSTWTLLAVFSLLVVKGICQDLDLLDALDDNPSTSAPKVKPAGGEVKPTPKRPVQTTVTVKTPVNPKPKQTGSDFDLADALNPDNDIKGKGKDSDKNDKGFAGGGREDGQVNSRGGTSAGGFSNDDLVDIGNDNTYKPDKGKGGQGTRGNDLGPADENNYDTMAETGTIAGIVSAIGMALAGAVSGYISYQKKKLCFSIQQSLNTDLVKADAPDAVVAQEPQVQQTLLQPPNAEPPTEENAV
ncbi:CD99 antigen-like protein 2 isoform X3 [Triplophysa dalaica]|uniref:CD99 antigen-like protein 2 isoform X3 n=1 Tax=Triplophysa dalaica TaxID=1582913 RepID=UPI0024DF5907|nr:CD99 antigen-like protein 2 isoform X3 [Triplophysa dalaica]